MRSSFQCIFNLITGRYYRLVLNQRRHFGYEVLKYIKAFRNTMHISYEPLETVWNSKVCLIPLLFLLLQRETYLNISGIVHGAPVTCNVSTHF